MERIVFKEGRDGGGRGGGWNVGLYRRECKADSTIHFAQLHFIRILHLDYVQCKELLPTIVVQSGEYHSHFTGRSSLWMSESPGIGPSSILMLQPKLYSSTFELFVWTSSILKAFPHFSLWTFMGDVASIDTDRALQGLRLPQSSYVLALPQFYLWV